MPFPMDTVYPAVALDIQFIITLIIQAHPGSNLAIAYGYFMDVGNGAYNFTFNNSPPYFLAANPGGVGSYVLVYNMTLLNYTFGSKYSLLACNFTNNI